MLSVTMWHRNHFRPAVFLVVAFSLLVPPGAQATDGQLAAAREDVSLEYSTAAGVSLLAGGIAAAVAMLPMSHHAESREWLVNAGAVTESVAVTVMLTQVTKYVVRRERPSPSTCHPDRATESDRNLSFFSGHTAIALALVSSAHETARLRGQPTNNWIWVGGAAAAAA